jgi:Protein of unknown function (DUF2752)
MSAAPPKIPRRENQVVTLILGFITMGIGTLVFFFDPAKNHFYPVCVFHKITGLECPGCGGTRALYALLHGQFSAALHNNALFVALTFLSLLRTGWFALKKISGRENGSFFSAKFLWPLLVATLLFGVLRNLPWCAFLSPD